MDTINDEHLQKLFEILDGVMSPDNEIRSKAENILFKTISEYPNQAAIGLLICTEKAQDENVKLLCSLVLRQMLNALNSKDTYVWERLAENSMAFIRIQLLKLTRKEASPMIKRNLSITVSTLASTIISGKGRRGSWDELLPTILDWTALDNLHAECALLILSELFYYMTDDIIQIEENIFKMFSKHIVSSSSDLVLATVRAACSLIGAIDTPNAMFFQELVLPMLKAVIDISVYDSHLGMMAMNSLVELADSEPTFFRRHISSCYKVILRLFESTSDSALIAISLEFITILIEHMPDVINSNTSLRDSLCSKCFELIFSIPTDLSENWLKPSEGFDEETDLDSETDYGKVAVSLFSRLLDSCDDEAINTALVLVRSSINTGTDWRMKYAGFIMMSVLGHYINEPDKLEDFIDQWSACSDYNYHPKVRYAVYDSIAEMCEDFTEDFQALYGSIVLPILFRGLDDPAPRVAARACWALNKFVKFSTRELQEKYADDIVRRGLKMLNTNQSSIVIEKALDLINLYCTLGITKLLDTQGELIPYILNFIQLYSNPVYHRLRTKCLHCLFLHLSYQPKPYIKNLCAQIYSVLKSIQIGSSSATTQLIISILSVWQVLAQRMGQQFSSYISMLVKEILNLLEPIPIPEDKELYEEQIQADTEIKESALQTLLTFIDATKSGFSQFAEETSRRVSPLIVHPICSELRTTSATLITSLLKCLRGSTSQSLRDSVPHAARHYLGILWKNLETEEDQDVQMAHLEAIASINITVGNIFLVDTDINECTRRCISLLKDPVSLSRDIDPESDEAMSDLSVEDETKPSVAEVLGSLLRTHPDQCGDLITVLLGSIIPKYILAGLSDADHKLALCLLDDLIEFIGPMRLEPNWPLLIEPLVKYCTDKNPHVRQFAVYGLGIYIQNSPSQVLSPILPAILDTLNNSIEINPNKPSEDYLLARENAVAALGKLIQHHPSITNQEHIQYWIMCLPLKYDIKEGRAQHDLLLDLSRREPAKVFGNDPEKLLRLSRIFISLLGTPLLSKYTVGRIKGFFNWVKDACRDCWISASNGFTNQEKTRLIRLLTKH
jgi:hypothetical protein